MTYYFVTGILTTSSTVNTYSTTASNRGSNNSSGKLEEELNISSKLRKFSFNDLKLAARNFRPELLLGKGGFGCVFKGWVEENGTGLTVAVRTLNHDGTQRMAGLIPSQLNLLDFLLITSHLNLYFLLLLFQTEVRFPE